MGIVYDFRTVAGAPYGNRTRVSALRGPRPRPLDEGSLGQGRSDSPDPAVRQAPEFPAFGSVKRPPQGSGGKRSRPVGCMVLMSKARISTVPETSTVTTIRSSL